VTAVGFQGNGEQDEGEFCLTQNGIGGNLLAVATAGLGAMNFELFTNRANSSFLDFSVAGDARDLALCGVQPDGMPATLTIKLASLLPQVAL
jgi:hypothetical protein